MPTESTAEQILQLERDLRQKEALLAQLEQTAGVGSWSWDVLEDRVFWSPQMYRIAGWEVGSPVDLARYRTLHHPEDRDGMIAVVQRARESGTPYQIEHRIIRPDGAVRWLLGRGEAQRDANGVTIALFGTAQDITEQREAENRERELLREQVARSTAESSERRLQFLADASALLASSLNYEETLRNVARLAVPAVADWCAVDLVDPGGRVSRLAVEHSDAEKIELVREIDRRYPADPQAPTGVPHVIRTGRTELGTEIPPEQLAQAAQNDEHLQLLMSLGLRSYAILPLVARDHVAGAITVVYAESERRYGEEDIPMLEDLATRMAVAIDNSKLVRERELAQEQLEAQATELELQAEELQQQASHLEEVQAELEMANSDLREANEAVQKQADAAESDQREKTALLESAVEGIYGVDEKGRCTFVNPAACEQLGYSADEILGRDMHQLIHHTREDGTPHSAEECPIHRAVQAREPVRVHQDVLWRSDGTFFPVAYSSAPIIKGSSIQGAVVTFHDISERLRAQEALQEDAQIVDALHRIGQSVATRLDLQEIVQEVTDTATSLSGAQFGAFFYNVLNEKGEFYTLYTISGVPREMFSRFPMPRKTPVFGPTFNGDGVVRSDDITADPRYGRMAPHHGMPEGHLPVTSYLAVPVKSRSGEVLGGLFFGHEKPGVFKERHERLILGIAAWAGLAMDNAHLFGAEHLARTAAEDANRAKSNFLATMSHELRTPLNAILGYTDLLLQGIPDRIPSTAEHKVDRIRLSARHLRELIEEVLTFSRLEAGEEHLEVAEVDLNTVLSEVQALTEPLALEQGLEFHVHTPEARIQLTTDPRKLRQILLNLLGNAVKFTSSGEVALRVESVGSDLLLHVSDSGEGIASEHIEKIFDPFYQVDGGATRNAGGTGLGLSVSRRFARLLGGDVVLESEPGRGTTFTVRIPLELKVMPDQEPAGRTEPHEIG